MGGDLDDVVGGVGMGLREVCDNDFVHAIAMLVWRARSTRFDEFSKHSPPRLRLMPEPQHRRRDLAGAWAGNPHNANPAAARRRGDGNNRVVKVHRAIVAVKLEGQPAAGCESTPAVPES